MPSGPWSKNGSQQRAVVLRTCGDAGRRELACISQRIMPGAHRRAPRAHHAAELRNGTEAPVKRSLRQAPPQHVEEEGWSVVEGHLLETQRQAEEHRRKPKLISQHERRGPEGQAQRDAVVLKVSMVNQDESWLEQQGCKCHGTAFTTARPRSPRVSEASWQEDRYIRGEHR